MLRALLLHYVISWALFQYTAGNLLGGGTGSGWYPPQPQPFIPPLPPPPVVETPVCLEWGDNIVNKIFPFGPIVGGDGGVRGAGCTGYSINICPLGSINTGVVEAEEDEIVEVIDEKIVEVSTGQVLSEQREVFDVTNQFYPNNYNPYGRPPFQYYPPSPPSYPYFPPSPPVNFGFQTGASRSLGEE